MEIRNQERRAAILAAGVALGFRETMQCALSYGGVVPFYGARLHEFVSFRFLTRAFPGSVNH